jgi:hypothetical protein
VLFHLQIIQVIMEPTHQSLELEHQFLLLAEVEVPQVLMLLPGNAGGSGGGAPGILNATIAGGAGNAGGYTPVEGYAGGSQFPANYSYSGSGGGRSRWCWCYAANQSPGNGGPGLTSVLLTAIGDATSTGQLSSSSRYYAGGGGGGCYGEYEPQTNSVGGIGGGGAGGTEI